MKMPKQSKKPQITPHQGGVIYTAPKDRREKYTGMIYTAINRYRPLMDDEEWIADPKTLGLELGERPLLKSEQGNGMRTKTFDFLPKPSLNTFEHDGKTWFLGDPSDHVHIRPLFGNYIAPKSSCICLLSNGKVCAWGDVISTQRITQINVMGFRFDGFVDDGTKTIEEAQADYLKNK